MTAVSPRGSLACDALGRGEAVRTRGAAAAAARASRWFASGLPSSATPSAARPTNSIAATTLIASAALRQLSSSMAGTDSSPRPLLLRRRTVQLDELQAPLFLLAAAAAALTVTSGSVATPTLARLDVPRDLKVVSYFPVHAGWTKMWTDCRPHQIDADLVRAASLHANTVRAIVQPDLF